MNRLLRSLILSTTVDKFAPASMAFLAGLTLLASMESLDW